MRIERVGKKYLLILGAMKRMTTKTTNLQQVANTKNVYRISIINFSSHDFKSFENFFVGLIFKRFEFFLTNQEKFFIQQLLI
jgi:hypothetical protein